MYRYFCYRTLADVAWTHDQPQGPLVTRLRAPSPEARVPGARLQVCTEPGHDALLAACFEECPGRLRPPDRRIEVALGAGVERLDEAVEAVPGDRNALDRRAFSQAFADGRE